jgi:hypothetical protein
MTMFQSAVEILTLCLVTVVAQASFPGPAALTPGGTDYQAYYDAGPLPVEVLVTRRDRDG